MLSISTTDRFFGQHPQAVIGVLELSGVDNRAHSELLNGRKRELEVKLREQYHGYARPEFNSLPVIGAYRRYYKRFKKSYHVQLQLESIVLKGKSLPQVSPLVDANFMAEVEHLVLTAGHDVAKLEEPVLMDVSQDGDQITQMNGATKVMRPGDMIMRDAGGASCSVIYGQDNRSPISRETSHVLYITYAPEDVPRANIEAHMDSIVKYVRLFSPAATVEQQRLITARK